MNDRQWTRFWIARAAKTGRHFPIVVLVFLLAWGTNGWFPAPTLAAPPQTMALVTIRATGFEPATLTLPTGPFLFVVQNRSGLAEVVLQLNSQQIRVPKEKLDWYALLNLPAGTYNLSEANHPGWSCRITVAAAQK